MANRSGRRLLAADYKIACVCPMGVELAPVEGMLDEIHDPLPIQRDQNAYSFGKIGVHNVVIAIMPEIGNNAAATTVTQLLNDFPAIRFGLLVGIGGGIPGDTDIRLGDVVIAQSTDTFPGVVQYDMGKTLEGGRFLRTGSLNKPPAILSAHVRKLDGQHRRLGHNLLGYISEMLERYPTMQTGYSFPTTAGQDKLFIASYEHHSGPTCDQCDDQYVVPRLARSVDEPRIHYGTIGSANQVVKDATIRDKIRADTHALCIEMEAAGLMGDFPCLVIRGICDYADSHKNKIWQPYAAAVAAAYMKALLLIIPDQEVSSTSHEVGSAIPVSSK